MTIKKDPWFNVSKWEWESIEKKLAKKAVEKKKKTTKKKVVKKVWKSKKTKKETDVKAKKESKWQTKKKTIVKKVKKSTNKETGKTGKESKNIEDVVGEMPSWFLDLFQYLDLVDGIDVLSTGKEESPKKRTSSYSSPNEIWRRLFLIFMSSPKKIRDEDLSKYKKLSQKEFSEHLNLSENTLSEWKRAKWFRDNHAEVMKNIFRARTPEILDSLYEGATTKVNEWWKRDAAAIKLWLEYIEWFKPGVDMTSGWEEIKVFFWNWKVWQSQFINKNQKKWESKA